jgi:ribosomal protein S12 methylthiotransferase
MRDLVATRTARMRQRKLMALQRKISQRRLRSRVESDLEILIDGWDRDSGLLEGRFFGQAPEVDGKVIVPEGSALPGQMRWARITDAGDYDLYARLLETQPTDASRRRAPSAIAAQEARA